MIFSAVFKMPPAILLLVLLLTQFVTMRFGPSLNILVKLMSVVALVLAPLLASMGGGLVSF